MWVSLGILSGREEADSSVVASNPAPTTMMSLLFSGEIPDRLVYESLGLGRGAMPTLIEPFRRPTTEASVSGHLICNVWTLDLQAGLKGH